MKTLLEIQRLADASTKRSELTRHAPELKRRERRQKERDAAKNQKNKER